VAEVRVVDVVTTSHLLRQDRVSGSAGRAALRRCAGWSRSAASRRTARRQGVPGAAWPGDGLINTLGGEGDSRRQRCLGARTWRYLRTTASDSTPFAEVPPAGTDSGHAARHEKERRCDRQPRPPRRLSGGLYGTGGDRGHRSGDVNLCTHRSALLSGLGLCCAYT
jgi:hypothetical protein